MQVKETEEGAMRIVMRDGACWASVEDSGEEVNHATQKQMEQLATRQLLLVRRKEE